MIKEINYKDTLFIRQQVLWPDKPLEDMILDVDSEGVHFGYYRYNILIGVISLFIKNKSAQFRKFAVIKEFQSKGIGSKLLTHTIQYASNSDALDIWCNARTTANAFYKRFGLSEVENTRFYRGEVEYSIMKKGF